MKIVVAVKQVPERDAVVRVAADGRGVDASDVSWTMNEPDAYALEEALQLKERAGSGEVVVLCAGPERVQSTLREALAKGADRAVHVVTPEEGEGSLGERDSLDVARLLAEAVRAESADLVLTGLQSDDLGAGQTGVVMAELLGVPHATLVLQVELLGSGSGAGGNSGIRVKRELEDGWMQHVEMPLPALLTVQSGGNRLRYATLMGIKKARQKEMREVEAAAAGKRVDEVVKVSPPTRVKRTEMLTGTAESIAAVLIERLRFEVKVL
ncbi:MAG: electron transfer flavoprotein subunit beta/FixA family protein [Acidobacteria bacterium]|nr:electron transfer flavoprotein subunit beta/FixA family protein [Acidobacteriota bacterium]